MLRLPFYDLGHAMLTRLLFFVVVLFRSPVSFFFLALLFYLVGVFAVDFICDGLRLLLAEA